MDIERAIVLALSDDFDVISCPQAEKLGPLELLDLIDDLNFSLSRRSFWIAFHHSFTIPTPNRCPFMI